MDVLLLLGSWGTSRAKIRSSRPSTWWAPPQMTIQKERTDWNPTTIAVTGEGVGKGENRRRRKDRRPEREEMRRRRMSESPETGGGERRGRE
ncbi:hypothetical protein MRB53_014917 [Persea americana]|uniref:Uncharacterized protein n=1 Tax=Persea americana TaxID=3435 RepID=A0ACC2KCA4_PERAE|nr:hypothetical protein MRB53_014917 [Persea americana]